MEALSKADQEFLKKNKKEISALIKWVNGFIEAGDIKGLQSAGVTLQSMINLIVNVLAVTLPPIDNAQKH